MITRDELIEIGTFNKPHGVDGEISATFDCDCDTANEFSCFVCEIDGIYVPFFADSLRGKGTMTLLLKFEGLDSADAVRRLVNKAAYVLKREYDELQIEYDDGDEVPTDYFIGYVLYDGIEPVGEIVDIDDATENVLFVVERVDGTTVLVPAADDLVTNIDLEGKTITMTLPSGLLEM